MPDDSAADAERVAELIRELWLATKPSHEAQGIRAALSTSVDDARFPTWALDQLPDHIWNLVDVAAQRALDSRDAALREARAEIASKNVYIESLNSEISWRIKLMKDTHHAAPPARVVEAANKMLTTMTIHRHWEDFINELISERETLRDALDEYRAALPNDGTIYLNKSECKTFLEALENSTLPTEKAKEAARLYLQTVKGDATSPDDGWRPDRPGWYWVKVRGIDGWRPWLWEKMGSQWQWWTGSVAGLTPDEIGPALPPPPDATAPQREENNG